jgi:hypothetical protein
LSQSPGASEPGYVSFGIQSFHFKMVPLAGIEPALLAELDFESSASTSSATGAFGHEPKGRALGPVAKPAEYSRREVGVNPRGCDYGAPRQEMA